MMKVPMCFYCDHFLEANKSTAKCSAFPDGIPVAIFSGEVSHVGSYPNEKDPQDNGIQFKPRQK